MVDQVEGAPRSRRALLTAAAAAGAAAVASAVVKPIPVLAATDDNADMFVGTVYGDVSLSTGLTNHTNSNIVFSGTSTTGGIGLYGASNNIGVFGGGGTNGIGVEGASGNNYGVYGTSTNNNGVRASSTNATALYAESTNSAAIAGVSSAASATAVSGWAHNGSTGVLGYSGNTLDLPSARANTGVYGRGNGSATGGYFESDSGSGGHFKSGSGNAIRVDGKASFTRAGRTNIARNKTYVDVTVPGGLGATAFVVATLQYPRTGVWVRSARINYPASGQVRIQLNKVASTTASTPVGWFVVG